MTRHTCFSIVRTGFCALCFFICEGFLAGGAFAQGLYGSWEDEDDPLPQRVLTIIDGLHPYDLNPHTASYTSESQVLTGLYEGLFSYDPVTLDPLNAICASYKVSRDKKRWTFTLREGVTFSDGSPITAATIRASWLTLLATKNAPFASLIDCISGAKEFRTGTGVAKDVLISARDEKTLVVHLEKPTEHLPRILCHHAFSAVSPKKGVYSGPFVLESYKNNVAVLKKNERYRDAESVRLPGIRIEQSDDADENAWRFNTGTADWITGGASVSKILNQDSIHVAAEFGTSYLFFKTANTPWNNADVRAALLEAIPYNTLRKDYAIPATTFIYPLSGYPQVSGFDDYDAEDALILMNKARTSLGIPANKKLVLTFAITDSDYMRSWAQVLQDAWEPLGVTLVLQQIPAEEYNAAIQTSKADLFSYSWIGDFADPLAFLELFRSNSSLNVGQYNNTRFDTLLNQAAVTRNSADRLKILSQAEQVLLDDCVIIPISHPISLHIIDSAQIGGWQTNALDLHPFKYLYLKRKRVKVPNVV